MIAPVDERHVVMSWGDDGPKVVSGGMRGESELAGKPAALGTPTGHGAHRQL